MEPENAHQHPRGLWASLAGLCTLFLGSYVFHDWPAPPLEGSRALRFLFTWRYALVLIAIALSMFSVEAIANRPWRRSFRFDAPVPVDGEGRRRIRLRWIGLMTLALLTWIPYVLLKTYKLPAWIRGVFRDPEQGFDRVPEFFALYFVMMISVAALSPIYFWIRERYDTRRNHPEDSLLAFGRWLTRLIPWGWASHVQAESHPVDVPWTEVRHALLKLLFLPILFNWYLEYSSMFPMHTNYVRDAFNNPDLFGVHPGLPEYVRYISLATFSGLFLAQVTLELIGCLWTVRIFDTHVRSVDPNLLGWICVLAFYQPFARATQRIAGIPNNGMFPSSTNWQSFFENSWMLIPWGTVIVLLMLAVVYTTAEFGLRYTQLTYRGIVDRGLYRLVRHPAYACMLVAWWMMALPMFALAKPWHATVGLAFWSILIIARVVTEERHLAHVPEYQAYREKVRWRLFPGVW